MSDTALETAERIHRESVVYDMVSPLFAGVFPRSAADYRAGGVTAIGATVSSGSGNVTTAEEGFRACAHLHGLIRSQPDELMAIASADDFDRAKAANKLGVVFHLQTCSPFENRIELVEAFYRLGVRAALLTYNSRNHVADGCTERTDAGLSRFGVRVVREMNRLGMVVDGSHTGYRSTMDAMDVCEGPFIFSHSGAKAVFDHPRNIKDDQIKRCAASGGVVGVVGLPHFVGDLRDPKLENVVRHVAYLAELVGPAHVGIGMDYFGMYSPYASIEQQRAVHKALTEGDLWDADVLPEPPWACAPGIETPAGMRNLTAAILRHGFSEAEVRGIMGLNFLRVFRQVWRPVAQGAT